MSDKIVITIKDADGATTSYQVHPDVMGVVRDMLEAFNRRDPLERELSDEELSKGAALARREKDR